MTKYFITGRLTKPSDQYWTIVLEVRAKSMTSAAKKVALFSASMQVLNWNFLPETLVQSLTYAPVEAPLLTLHSWGMSWTGKKMKESGFSEWLEEKK